ncbi:MAG TPA: alpha-(1-_3)-arabinofuranosyltransferase family protein [Candidatus Limnocylindrales bacterium]|nr:alpha-(1->3)-arabinofuranosyltransferase family protein [Candidatus Limnocylindrales bacterium]
MASVVMGWYDGDNVLDTLDLAYPYDPEAFFRRLFYIWNDTNNLGTPDSRIVANLLPYGVYIFIANAFGFSVSATQKLFMYIVVAGAGLSMYYLTRRLGGNKLAATLAGALYMANPYTLTYVWVMRNLFVLSYAFIPLVLGHFIKISVSKNFLKSSVIHALLVVSLLTSAFSNPAVFIMYACTIVLLALVLSLKHQSVRPLGILATSLSVIVILSSFWMVPLTGSLNSEYSNASNKSSKESDDLNVLTANSKTPADAFNLTGYWMLHSDYKGDAYYPWYKLYQNPFVYLLSFLPFVSFITYLFVGKDRYVKIFLGVLVLVSFFFLTGTKGIFVDAKQVVFEQLPALTRTIRSLETKFSPLLLLGLAPAFGLLIAGVLKTYKRSLVSLTVAVSVLMYFALPVQAFFTGDVIYGGGKVIPSTRVRPPDYYADAKNWLSTQPDHFKIASLPVSNTYLGAYDWPSGFAGTDPARYLLDKPVLTSNTSPNSFLIPSTISDIAGSDGGDSFSSISRIAGLANIKYLLLHNDAKWNYITGNDYWRQIERDSLRKLEDQTKPKKFGNLSFLNIEENNLNDLIYVPRNTINYKGDINTVLKAFSSNEIYRSSSVLNEVDKFGTNDSNTNMQVLWSSASSAHGKKQDARYPGNWKVQIKNSEDYVDISSRMMGSVYEIRFTKSLPAMEIEDKPIVYDAESKILSSQVTTSDERQYIKVDNELLELSRSSEWSNLGRYKLKQGRMQTPIYKVASNDLINNGGFESGLWQKTVTDCSLGAIGKPKFNQSIVTDRAEGNQALKLTSASHFACVKKEMVRSNEDDLVKVRVNYKNLSELPARYCIWENVSQQCLGLSKVASSDQWMETSSLITPDSKNSRLSIYLYSIPKSGQPNTVLYDGISASSYTFVRNVDVQFNVQASWGVLGEYIGNINVDSLRFIEKPSNLVKNNSFSDGLWQKAVGDCSASKPGTAQIDMQATKSGQDGIALNLVSDNHAACTWTDMSGYDEDRDYKLSIQFKNNSGSLPQICVWEDLNNKCLFKTRLLPTESEKMDGGWYRWEKAFRSSEGATAAKIFLYSEASDVKTSNDFDDIDVRSLPLSLDTSIVASSAGNRPAHSGGNVKYVKYNTTLYGLNIEDQTDLNFIFTETFNSGWHAYIMKDGLPSSFGDHLRRFLGGWPEYKIPDEHHILGNGYANEWKLDSVNVPKEFRDSEGKYTVLMEYSPQKKFYIGSILSILAFLVCILYLVVIYSPFRYVLHKFQNKFRRMFIKS